MHFCVEMLPLLFCKIHKRTCACCSQEYTKEERAALAAQSRACPPQFGSPDRQRVTDELHADMLAADARQAPRAVPSAAAANSGEGVQAAGHTGPADSTGAQTPPCRAEEASSALLKDSARGQVQMAIHGFCLYLKPMVPCGR